MNIKNTRQIVESMAIYRQTFRTVRQVFWMHFHVFASAMKYAVMENKLLLDQINEFDVAAPNQLRFTARARRNLLTVENAVKEEKNANPMWRCKPPAPRNIFHSYSRQNLGIIAHHIILSNCEYDIISGRHTGCMVHPPPTQRGHVVPTTMIKPFHIDITFRLV